MLFRQMRTQDVEIGREARPLGQLPHRELLSNERSIEAELLKGRKNGVCQGEAVGAYFAFLIYLVVDQADRKILFII